MYLMIKIAVLDNSQTSSVSTILLLQLVTKPLLIKKEVGSVQPNPKKPPQNVPNIYVLNKEGYEQEIEWAIAKMLEIYNVDSFGEIKGGNKH